MDLSDLARFMAEDLRIDGLDIQAFICAIDDGGEQLEELGYSQEEIERVLDELCNEKF